MIWEPRDRAPFGQLTATKKGAGDAVLFLHGVGLRAEAWAAQIDEFAREFSVAAPDMPGHGESKPFDFEARLADFTEQVAAAISAPTFVVGHSMGAMIALDLAFRYPDKVRAVAALNAIFQRDTAAKAAVLGRAEAMKISHNPDAEPTLQRWFGASESPERQACHRWLTSLAPHGYRTAYAVFANEDGPSEAALSALACPALFITGSAEPNSTPTMSREMARLTPNGRAEIVDGAAHMMPMTHPSAVNAALLSFFRDVSR